MSLNGTSNTCLSRRNRQKFVAKIGVKYKCVMYLSAYFYLGE